MTFDVVIAADWGKHPRKRSAYEIDLRERRGRFFRPGAPLTLQVLIERCARHRATHARCLIGIDAALGLASEVAGAGGFSSFRHFLRCLSGPEEPFWKEVHAPGGWSPQRPFWSMCGHTGPGALRRFVQGIGVNTKRRIDHLLRANDPLLVSGLPGTVGSGTRALWQELRSSQRDVALWPFDGTLHDLARTGLPVLAEVYPKAGYGIALHDRLPAPMRPLAKRRSAVRRQVLDELLRTEWTSACSVTLQETGSVRQDDDFDALLMAAALARLELVDRWNEEDTFVRSLGDAFACATEGGVLGSGAVAVNPLPSRARAHHANVTLSASHPGSTASSRSRRPVGSCRRTSVRSDSAIQRRRRPGS